MFELLYVISTCLVKVSFCISLLRIANVRFQIYAIYVVLTVTVVFSIFYFVWIIVECHPVSYLWEQFSGHVKGQCRPVIYMVYATYAHGTVMCLGDLSLAVLPVVLVVDLHLSSQTKASVALLLALGSVYVSSHRSVSFLHTSVGTHLLTSLGNSASVATIARIPYVHRLEAIDFFYANNEILIWSIVEVGISIIATAAATLRPLLAKLCLFPLHSQRGTNRYSTGVRFGTSRTEWSGLGEGSGTPNSEQRNTHMASRWLSQRTKMESTCEEERNCNHMSSEAELLDWEIDHTAFTVTTIKSHLGLEDLDVPECGI